MYRFGEVGAAEVALGENHPLGMQAGQILVPEFLAGEFTVRPIRHGWHYRR